ncbi:prenyltransferase/squalene oxidase repeat-containing protein [Streptomyces sp. NPDC052701]|uniref:prenyltransferase/squalene oxidase repeat-containing protein n=1 Tax=Streptomyces sp. NPDC052701 TaxID=3155533 RepID=UPI003444F6F7
MNVRRSAAVLAAAAVLGTAVPAVAAGPSPSAARPAGLYGTSDPTYDGVWRQSLAMIAQDAVGVVPSDRAVDWLAGQQCGNGAFAAYRADTAEPCDARTKTDTNSTAAAVQALATTGGHDAVVDKALTWLKSAQNEDGGWGYAPGGPSDANSTSVVIGALVAAGTRPQDVRKDGRSPYDALLRLALPCEGEGAGGFAYQPDKDGGLTANADATAAAVVGALGETLAGARAGNAEAPPPCEKAADPERAAYNGAAHLARAMAEDGHLTSSLPGSEDQPDYGNTADAVVALSTAGYHDEAAKSLRWLESHALKWAERSGPAAYAQLVLAAVGAESDPRDFGGRNLVSLLNATGPAPAEEPDPDTIRAKGLDPKDDDGVPKAAWAVGGVLLAGAAAGFVLVARGRRRQS